MPLKCRYCDQTWRDLLVLDYIEHLIDHSDEWAKIWKRISPKITRGKKVAWIGGGRQQWTRTNLRAGLLEELPPWLLEELPPRGQGDRLVVEP